MSIKNESVIRVLVVDDSAFMRRVISDILDSDGDIKTIDTARNGKEAIEKAVNLKPDIITLDVEMPVMDGLTCLKELSNVCSIPVIMLSSHTKEGAEATINALEHGAIDFITKPSNIFHMNSLNKRNELIEKVKVIAKLKNNTSRAHREILEVKNHYEHQKGLNKGNNQGSHLKKIVAIGISTGGPKALRDVIPQLPGDIPAAFLVVQHMPPGFTKSLAERLDSLSNVRVKEAEDNEMVRPGVVYIAPGDYHMKIALARDKSLTIKLTKDPPYGAHRPSATVMMESLSETGLANIVGIIMTGMGSDGSEGARRLKEENNGYIIAQDEKTCIVYGMPKVAVELGIVDEVVPLEMITKKINEIVGV
ncbi:MAG TPA: chemotaxis response regulator protein-glutamate methylesterase [Pseudobacteroides sp.]|uniref:protein-glutamate methylesterase/protein-glutamine glutaminase n=1 Tax=Pseudobacteroides sp. TaxID=1968840 RepID=UPI002F9300CD